MQINENDSNNSSILPSENQSNKLDLTVNTESSRVSSRQKPKFSPRKFMIVIAVANFFLMLPLICLNIVYFVDKYALKNFFRNYTHLGNGYDIFFALLLLVTLVIPSVFV